MSIFRSLTFSRLAGALGALWLRGAGETRKREGPEYAHLIPPFFGDPNGSSAFAGHVWRMLSQLQRIILVNKKILRSCCICYVFGPLCHPRLREIASRTGQKYRLQPLPSVNWFTLGSIQSGIIFGASQREG